MLTANTAPQKGNYEKSYTAAVFDAETTRKAPTAHFCGANF
jgi:hypothetical protein